MARILIIDDDQSVPRALQAALTKVGHEVTIATDAEEGRILAEEQECEVVVADLHWEVGATKQRKPQGLDIIAKLRATKPQLPIILMTAIPTTETTIEAGKRGAYDYITKPTNETELKELLEAVNQAAGAQRLRSESGRTREKSFGKEWILGKSLLMQNVYKQIGRVAAKPVTVLILGETGTGKELVARAIHQYSDREKEALVTVNCVAIPESLLESELFGHEQGAFTGASTQRVGRFEQANRGTIFLDEIGDVSLHTQAKLLRVLQEKTIQRVGGKGSFHVDVRVIAATHRDLENAVEEKAFRRDLYYRLNDAIIRLPSLRERKEDIPELAHFFLQQHAAELGAVGSTIDREATKYLQQQPWPGNVRELDNVIRKSLLAARGHRIDLDIVRRMLDETRIFRRFPAAAEWASSVGEQALATYVSDLLDSAERGECEDVAALVCAWAEREIYGQAINLAAGDQTKAARWLGVSRPTIREKLSRYNLRPALARAREGQAA